jgi:hypothetical protein
VTRFAYSRRAFSLRRDRRVAVERLAAIEELAVNLRRGADPQGVALAAPYGHALVERGPLGGLQLGGAEEVRDLARHIEDDRQSRSSRGTFV